MTDLKDEAVDKFGQEQVDGFIMIAKAMRSLIYMGEVYFFTPTDTELERITGAKFDQMLDAAAQDPAKASELMQALVALVIHLKNDGDFDTWFTSMGVGARPGED